MILPERPISWRYLKHLLRIYGNSKHHDSQLSAVATLITRDVLLRLVLVPADTAVHKLNHCVSITCSSLIVLTDCRYCMETIFITYHHGITMLNWLLYSFRSNEKKCHAHKSVRSFSFVPW